MEPIGHSIVIYGKSKLIMTAYFNVIETENKSNYLEKRFYEFIIDDYGEVTFQEITEEKAMK